VGKRSKKRQAVSTVVQEAQQPAAPDDRARRNFEAALAFAKSLNLPIWNVADSSTKESVTYTRYSKTDLLDYLQSPTSNEKNLRNASIYMWDASSHYRRLITYYAMLPKWAYILAPSEFDRNAVKEENFRKQYFKVQNYLDVMNLRHELQKASMITYRDGVLYGAIWRNNVSFYVQRINPDWCSLTSISDGVWNYSVDMSKIQEKKLNLYPPEFTTMYNAYKNGGNKWQEVPESISFCLKADETMPIYSIPPWSSTLPMLYDIETYKALQETATQIANYKLIGMQIELNADGTPTVDWDLAEQYYRQLCNVLPPYVGAFMAPMKAESYEFDKTGNTHDVDTVSRAEEQYWFNTGTSALLHGSNISNTAGALKLSIRTDEEIAFALMNQVERLINRILKSVSKSIKFRIHFLPTTIFNYEDQAQLYQNAATLGVPGSKVAYAATIDLPQSTLIGMEYLENDIYQCQDWLPLQSGYSGGGSLDKGGRPAASDVNLDDAGVATRENDTNANR
jgi:hypothetical protein